GTDRIGWGGAGSVCRSRERGRLTIETRSVSTVSEGATVSASVPAGADPATKARRATAAMASRCFAEPDTRERGDGLGRSGVPLLEWIVTFILWMNHASQVPPRRGRGDRHDVVEPVDCQTHAYALRPPPERAGLCARQGVSGPRRKDPAGLGRHRSGRRESRPAPAAARDRCPEGGAGRPRGPEPPLPQLQQIGRAHV